MWDCSYDIQAQKATITRLYYRDSNWYFRAIGLSLYTLWSEINRINTNAMA